MHVDDTKNSHRYDMIMVQDLMLELGLYIKFSDCTVRGENTEPFEGCYTLMQDFKELMDTNINGGIISDEIYYGE